MHKSETLDKILLLTIVLAVAGCSGINSTTNDAKAIAVEPAPNAGFIENPERQVKRIDLPFQKVWIKTGFDMGAYHELVLAPVNTQYMMKMHWLHKTSSAHWIANRKPDELVTDPTPYTLRPF